MNGLVLLMGLLVLSTFGSFLAGGRRLRGFGLPSGSEYVVLGFLLGPRLLGLIDRAVVERFEPVGLVAMSWLALLVGLEFGFAEEGSADRPHERRIPLKRILVSSSLALFTGLFIFCALLGLLTLAASELSGRERLILAGGIAAASAETTRHAIRWVVERHQAKGPISELLADVADADEILPLMSLGLLFALGDNRPIAAPLPAIAYVGLSMGLGAVLGALVASLIGRRFRLDAAWGLLIGASLLAFGLAERLGLPSLTVAFFLGLTLANVSRHRRQLVRMVLPTESSVMLPALLLAGARIDWSDPAPLIALVLAAALARAGAKLLLGLMLRPILKPLGKTRARLGLGLMPTGALSLGVGLMVALRFPGSIGDLVLAVTASLAVIGELLGPSALVAELRRAGEITDGADNGDSGTSDDGASDSAKEPA